jgi:hypothetical protein
LASKATRYVHGQRPWAFAAVRILKLNDTRSGVLREVPQAGL